jgi:hypothetical protein
MGVLERGDYLDSGTGAEPVRVGCLEHEPRPGFPVRGDLGDEDVRAVAVAKLTRVVAGVELQLVTELMAHLRRRMRIMFGCQQLITVTRMPT